MVNSKNVFTETETPPVIPVTPSELAADELAQCVDATPPVADVTPPVAVVADTTPPPPEPVAADTDDAETVRRLIAASLPPSAEDEAMGLVATDDEAEADADDWEGVETLLLAPSADDIEAAPADTGSQSAVVSAAPTRGRTPRKPTGPVHKARYKPFGRAAHEANVAQVMQRLGLEADDYAKRDELARLVVGRDAGWVGRVAWAVERQIKRGHVRDVWAYAYHAFARQAALYGGDGGTG